MPSYTFKESITTPGRNTYLHPWRARVKDRGVDYFLGYFRTHAEAMERENKFREALDLRPYRPSLSRSKKLA